MLRNEKPFKKGSLTLSGDRWDFQTPLEAVQIANLLLRSFFQEKKKMFKQKRQQMDGTGIYNLNFNSYKYCMAVSFPMNDGTGPVK